MQKDSAVSTLLHRRDVTHTPIHIHASVARGRAVQTDWEASATSLAVGVALLCSRATVWGGGLWACESCDQIEADSSAIFYTLLDVPTKVLTHLRDTAVAVHRQMQEVVVETGAPATLNYVSSSFVNGTSSLCVCARLPLQPAVQVDPSTHAKDLPHSRCYTTGAVATIWRVSSAAFVSPSSPTCQAHGHAILVGISSITAP